MGSSDPRASAAARPLVRAATELHCFGRTWVVAGAVMLAAAAVAAASAGVSARAAAAIAASLGLSSGAVLAALLVGRRTGPAILYTRILDEAPGAPASLPREPAGVTARRVLAPALLIAVVLAGAGPLPVAGLLVLVGERPDEILPQLPAAALTVGGGWTLLCGLAGLRMSHYFARWERRRGKAALCRPLSAGLMRHVYCVAAEPAGQAADEPAREARIAPPVTSRPAR